LLVSLAGVGSNFALAIISAVLYHLFAGNSPLLSAILQYAVGINLMLGVFNLVPIPPLDGSKALLSQLPYDLARKFESVSQYGFIVLSSILSLIVYPLQSLLGVPAF
jgi:Zn-dependent protease